MTDSRDEKTVQEIARKHKFSPYDGRPLFTGIGQTEELEAAIREAIKLTRDQQWIAVTPETMPEKGVQVFLWSSHGWATVGELRRDFRSSDGEWGWKNHADFPSECFTHWAPINRPSPPSREQQ